MSTKRHKKDCTSDLKRKETTSPSKVTKLYRIIGYSRYSVLHPQEYHILSETEYGWWIPRESEVIQDLLKRVKNKRRWVAKGGKNRFAYPTVEEAKRNYIARKRSQISYNKRNIMSAESGLRAAGESVTTILKDETRLEDLEVMY